MISIALVKRSLCATSGKGQPKLASVEPMFGGLATHEPGGDLSLLWRLAKLPDYPIYTPKW